MAVPSLCFPHTQFYYYYYYDIDYYYYHSCQWVQFLPPNATHRKVNLKISTQPNPAQPNPSRGSTQPTGNFDYYYY